MQKSNTSFYLTCAVLITLASLFYTWKYIVPKYQKTQSQIVGTDKEISAAKLKLESLDSTKKSLDQLGELVNKLFIAIPEDKDTPNLLAEIEAIANNVKLPSPLPSIQISDSAVSNESGVSGNLNSATAAFTATGTFEQLSTLLAKLENDVRFTNISSINFSKSKEQTITLSVQMEVFKRVATVVSTESEAVAE